MTREAVAAIALCLITALTMVLMVDARRDDEVVPVTVPVTVTIAATMPPPITRAPEPEVAEQKPVPGEGNFHGNTETHKFHRKGCRYYRCGNCTAKFETREEAIAAGYRACGTCDP